MRIRLTKNLYLRGCKGRKVTRCSPHKLSGFAMLAGWDFVQENFWNSLGRSVVKPILFFSSRMLKIGLLLSSQHHRQMEARSFPALCLVISCLSVSFADVPTSELSLYALHSVSGFECLCIKRMFIVYYQLIVRPDFLASLTLMWYQFLFGLCLETAKPSLFANILIFPHLLLFQWWPIIVAQIHGCVGRKKLYLRCSWEQELPFWLFLGSCEIIFWSKITFRG